VNIVLVIRNGANGYFQYGSQFFLINAPFFPQGCQNFTETPHNASHSAADAAYLNVFF
jgi:hypothetical protein